MTENHQRNDDLQQELAPTPQPLGTRTVTSSELLQGSKELLIIHGQYIYRLRETRNGKLILHK